MTKTQGQKEGQQGRTRQDRLKAALKANMGRRKAQARARSRDDAAPEQDQKPAQSETRAEE